MIQEILDQVREGKIDALLAYIKLKEIEKELKEALPAVNEEALIEASKHGLKTFNYAGAKITLKSNAGTWDYKHIDSWKIQKEKLKDVEEAAKLSYQSKGKSVSFDMNGEEIEAAKYTPGKDNISVELLMQEVADPLKELLG